MPGAENDVAALMRLKAAKDAAMAARQARDSRRPPPADIRDLRSAARSRWPACMALLRALAADYQRSSDDLGIRVEVEDVFRLRAWLPELSICLTRSDRELGVQVLFRMAQDGRIFCKVVQTRGWRQANLHRDDRPIDASERILRSLLKTIVQILIAH